LSDEPGPAEEPVRVPTGLFTHYCEHPGCGKWGSFGEPYGKETRWYCGEHRESDRS
jgi:hypothetical protein